MRVHMLAAALAAVAVLLAAAGPGEPAWGAVDLDAVINMEVDFAQFRTTYSDRIKYEYGEGSLLHQHLGGRQWVVEGAASEGRDVQKLENMLNGKITSNIGSPKISVSDVGYEFRLGPTSYGSAMERTVWITGNLTGYIANAAVKDMSTGHASSVMEGTMPADSLGTRQEWVAYATESYGLPDVWVERRWLIPIEGSDIVVDGVPINIPASLLREMEPEAYDLLVGTEADAILLRPLITSRQYVGVWQQQIYPAGTSVEADTFGLSGGVMDVDIHTWTIGVDGSGNGTEEADEVAITLDQTYVIRNIHNMSSATIRTIGIGVFDTVAVTDLQYVPGHRSSDNFKDASQTIFVFIVFTLAAIIAWMLYAARRRDKRLQRNGGGRQAKAGTPS